MNLADDGAHVVLAEDHHGVDVGKSSEDFRALFGGHQGTAFTFQRTHRFIRVQRNYQATTEFLGRVEITHVADVQQIEASVGEGNAVACRPPRFHLALQLVAPENLGFRRCVQCGLVVGGAESMACSNSCRVTVAVPRFITTIPPA